MSRSQRRIYHNLKANGFIVDAEHEAVLKEWNISPDEFKNKPTADKRRIIGLLQSCGEREVAEYLKKLK